MVMHSVCLGLGKCCRCRKVYTESLPSEFFLRASSNFCSQHLPTTHNLVYHRRHAVVGERSLLAEHPDRIISQRACLGPPLAV